MLGLIPAAAVLVLTWPREVGTYVLFTDARLNANFSSSGKASIQTKQNKQIPPKFCDLALGLLKLSIQASTKLSCKFQSFTPCKSLKGTQAIQAR